MRDTMPLRRVVCGCVAARLRRMTTAAQNAMTLNHANADEFVAASAARCNSSDDLSCASAPLITAATDTMNAAVASATSNTSTESNHPTSTKRGPSERQVRRATEPSDREIASEAAT